MNETIPSKRRVNADPHPELADAVSVSRFWRLVDVGPEDKCWPWMGCVDDDGYGIFVFRGRRHGAHELALSFSIGEKRHRSLDTCHECDNPPCCNPAHLRFDTRSSNVLDSFARGRSVRARKLTVEQVQLMRERRALGARQKDLAEQFGITDGLVSQIVRGLRWAHAGGPLQAERNSNV